VFEWAIRSFREVPAPFGEGRGGAILPHYEGQDIPRDADALARQIVEDRQEELELNQEQVSKRLGKSDRTFRNWMANLSELSASQVELLADALELSEPNRVNLYQLTGHLAPFRPPARCPPQNWSSISE
jgi:hypothetical protein